MNALTDIVSEKKEEKVKVKSTPVIFVDGIKDQKGSEISLGRLNKKRKYIFRIEKTPTFGINYNPPLTKEEIEEEITFHKKLNPCNKQKFYVAPIKRNK